MPNRIERKMQQLKEKKEKAFITYMTAGLPDMEGCKSLIRAQEEAGVDVLELGIPFSDPVADGPVIQAASYKSIQQGTSLKKGNNQYKVTSANIKNPTVKFTGLSKAEVKKADIPAAITVKGVKYKVTEIASGAAKDNKNITKLIVNKNVTKIGSNAFYGCTKLKNIRLKSKSITKIGGKAFKSVSPKAVCYTYYSRQSRYKSMLKKAGIKKPNMKRL